MPSADPSLAFERLQEEWAAGRLRVGVNRERALTFFTSQDRSQILEQTGVSLPLSWLLIRCAVLTAPLAIIGATLFGILVLPWIGLPLVAVVIAAYLTDRERSMDPGARLTVRSLLLGAWLLAPLALPPLRSSNLHGFGSMILIGLWSSRFAPVFAAHRFRLLVLHSPQAYAAHHESLLIVPVASPPL